MASPIRLTIQIADLDSVLARYDRIRVYRATAIDGTYAELTDATTRLRIVSGVTVYVYTDLGGTPASWYKTSFSSSTGTAESSFSEPQQGQDIALSAQIMSVEQLKQRYLLGVDLTDDAGVPYPTALFEFGITEAISWLETELDIKIQPTRIVERYDYYRRDYEEWLTFRLLQGPIIDDLTGVAESALPNPALTRVRVMWPSGQPVLEYDQRWIQINAKIGQLHVIPTAGTLSSVLMGAGGTLIPLLAMQRDFIPNLFEISYTAGFALGTLPYNLRDLIGMRASMAPLTVAGDILGGAGISSSSNGVDGLSQSISRTKSAVAGAYGARIATFEKKIGETLATARRYYKGLRLVAV